MKDISESIETAELWLDLWEDEQTELNEVDELDIEERKVILAMRAVIKRAKAAPDLLEALDSLVSACELPGDHCEVEQALPAAIAAIAKAIGGTP